MANDKPKKRQVITPGGPRASELVHGVGPGEVVHMDEAGEVAVKPVAVGTTREHKEGHMANALGRAIRASDIPAISGFVLTPGGFRPRSLVQRVEPGHALEVMEDRVMLRNVSTKAVQEIPLSVAPFEHLPALGSGWITYAYWNNSTGHTLTSFRTTWQVPPTPSVQEIQTIF